MANIVMDIESHVLPSEQNEVHLSGGETRFHSVSDCPERNLRLTCAGQCTLPHQPCSSNPGFRRFGSGSTGMAKDPWGSCPLLITTPRSRPWPLSAAESRRDIEQQQDQGDGHFKKAIDFLLPRQWRLAGRFLKISWNQHPQGSNELLASPAANSTHCSMHCVQCRSLCSTAQFSRGESCMEKIA